MSNPDFKSANEVVLSSNAKFGWTTEGMTLTEALYRERSGLDRLARDMPIAMQATDDIAPLPEVLAKWMEYQHNKGRYGESCDWTLLDEFTVGELNWLPQIIGSCVCSNTFPAVHIRQNYQISFQGLAEEFFGRHEFGPSNYAFYCPFTYGCARRRGNLRGGDGLFGDVMAESMLKDQFLLCNTPALLDILKKLGATKDTDFPEPQNAAVYRAFGDWNYLDDLRKYAGYGLQTCPPVTSIDGLISHLKMCQPVYCCSMLAIRKTGDHKDGWAIHKRNPNDQWAHNMCFHGFFYDSDGEMFIRFSNQSWGPKNIYNVPYAEVKDWFQNRNLTCYAIGRINGPSSSPLITA